MIALIHPTGNANVRALLQALEREGLLDKFLTTFVWRKGWPNPASLPQRIGNEARRRYFDEVPDARITSFPCREVVRVAAKTLAIQPLIEHESGWASVDRVCLDLDKRVARLIATGQLNTDAIYAYEDTAVESFRAAGQRGIKRIYELPIGYWRTGRRIMEEEAALRPEWAVTLDGLRDSPEKLERKDEELRSADHILVPSTYVRASLKEHPGFSASIDVVPYGAPTPVRTPPGERARAPLLRLLYVGQIAQRKGVAYLFDAMRQLKGIATLTLVGKPIESCAALSAELDRHDFLGFLSYKGVLQAMSEHDVLVFPSLFEGFALVILEAMAQGLPVITTPNSGAEAIVENGKDGYIVPIRDPEAIVQRVTELARSPDQLRAMRSAALAKAQHMSWANQQAMFVDVIRRRLGHN